MLVLLKYIKNYFMCLLYIFIYICLISQYEQQERKIVLETVNTIQNIFLTWFNEFVEVYCICEASLSIKFNISKKQTNKIKGN